MIALLFIVTCSVNCIGDVSFSSLVQIVPYLHEQIDSHEFAQCFLRRCLTIYPPPPARLPQAFHEAAYKAESRSDLMWAFKEFLDDTLVLPPIDWTANPDVLDVRELKQRSRDIQDKKRLKLDLEERLSEAPGSVVSGGVHRHSSVPGGDPGGDPLLPADDPLVRHGRPFAGFIRDVKRR